MRRPHHRSGPRRGQRRRHRGVHRYAGGSGGLRGFLHGTVFEENAPTEYTVTWVIDGATETATYKYGETPVHADPVKADYRFIGWTPAIGMVTGDVTYTAEFEAIVYTVTVNDVVDIVTPRALVFIFFTFPLHNSKNYCTFARPFK